MSLLWYNALGWFVACCTSSRAILETDSLIKSFSNYLPLINFFAVFPVATFHLLFLLFLFSSRFHPCIGTYVNPNYFGTHFLQVWSNSRNFGVILVLQLSLCGTMDSGVSTDLTHYFSPHFLQLWSNSRNASASAFTLWNNGFRCLNGPEAKEQKVTARWIFSGSDNIAGVLKMNSWECIFTAATC